MLPAAPARGATLMVPTEPGTQQCCSLARCAPGAWAEEVTLCKLWQRGHMGSWLSHLDPVVRANPCLRLPAEPGGARGAAGSDAAGHPPPLRAGLGFTRVPSHAPACAHDARVLPRVLSCALPPTHYSQTHVRCARAALGKTLACALGWLVPLHGPPGSMGWWQRPPVCGDWGEQHGLAVGLVFSVRCGSVGGGGGSLSWGAEQPPLIYWDGEKRKPPKPKQKTKEKSQPHEREDRGGLLGAACHLARCQPGDAPEQTCQAVIADRLISRDETVIFNSR